MDREERQRKVEEMCKEKQDMEMAQCTFRPELFSRGTRKVTTSELYLASFAIDECNIMCNKEKSRVG
jgi:hypothetical protein